MILFELYGFILPALSPHERRIAMPLLTAVPFLFAAGVLFGYFVVLPAAMRFFVNFNSSEFNVLVQANPYYNFAATILLAMGLVFQVPVAILGATRAGDRHPADSCARTAATRSSRARRSPRSCPATSITLLLETVPLYLLYEVSILLAALVGRAHRAEPRGAAARATAGVRHPAEEPAPSPPEDPAEPTVQEIIDHIDPGCQD